MIQLGSMVIVLAVDCFKFRAADLSFPFRIARTFDLAVSLELAEHLPSQSAKGFVDSLARFATGTIPLQGDTQHWSV
jgi:hypothetical protein